MTKRLLNCCSFRQFWLVTPAELIFLFAAILYLCLKTWPREDVFFAFWSVWLGFSQGMRGANQLTCQKKAFVTSLGLPCSATDFRREFKEACRLVSVSPKGSASRLLRRFVWVWLSLSPAAALQRGVSSNCKPAHTGLYLGTTHGRWLTNRSSLGYL